MYVYKLRDPVEDDWQLLFGQCQSHEREKGTVPD